MNSLNNNRIFFWWNIVDLLTLWLVFLNLHIYTSVTIYTCHVSTHLKQRLWFANWLGKWARKTWRKNRCVDTNIFCLHHYVNEAWPTTFSVQFLLLTIQHIAPKTGREWTLPKSIRLPIYSSKLELRTSVLCWWSPRDWDIWENFSFWILQQSDN